MTIDTEDDRESRDIQIKVKQWTERRLSGNWDNCSK
jgi:hypothetical protein